MKVVIDSKIRRDFALNLIQNIRAEDCPLELTLEPPANEKTTEQRGLFHALCRQMAKETGYTEGQVKELIKKHILGTKMIELAGKQYEVTSSSEVSDDGKPRDKLSYSELIEGCYEIAGQAGIGL